MPRGAKEGRLHLAGLGQGRGGWAVLTGSLGLWPLTGRPPTNRVWAWGRSAPWCSWSVSLWPWAWTPSITNWIRVFSQRTDTWRGGASGWGLPGPLHFPPPCPLPRATDQPVNAGGSGHGTGAQGLLSERQSVGDSEREPGRGCRWPGTQRRPRVLEGCEGGPAARAGTCNSSGGVSLGGPSTPPHTWPSLTSPQGVPGRLQTPGNWTGDPQIGRHLLWS